MFGGKKYMPYLFVLLIILVGLYFGVGYFFSGNNVLDKKKEGFVASKWSYKTIRNFLNYENTTNPNLVFDVDVIQQQATEAEAKTLMETGMWPWDDVTQKLYMDAIKSNTMLKTSPRAAMNQARAIYNQTIIREMMSWNAAEGQFLLNGVYATAGVDADADIVNGSGSGSGSYGINSGLINKSKNIIKCGIDTNNKVSLQMIQDAGNDGITGAHKKNMTSVDYNMLPKLVSGFRFINSPCDPCTAVNSPPGYTCPFSLSSNDPSPIWMSLWGLQSSASDVSGSGSDKGSKSVDPNKFPILNELKNELDTMFPNTGITQAK
jgi:hypothetical protein